MDEFNSIYQQKAKLLVKLMKLEEDKRKVIMKALEFASEAHKGQKRLNGKPYAIHLIRVALCAMENGMDENSIAAALLHDVVEDTGKNIEEIKKEFGGEVANLVELLTKKENESKEGYLMRVSTNEKARLLKACDALDNLRDLKGLTKERSKEWIKEHKNYYSSIVKKYGNESLRSKIDEVEKELSY